jgi:hypothetical protein
VFVRALKEQLPESEEVHAAVGSALMLVVLRAAAKAGASKGLWVSMTTHLANELQAWVEVPPELLERKAESS